MPLTSLIGQFGVGFYSSFMVADLVTLVTRRAGETHATRWESSGDGTYTITEGHRFSRGTSITLHLKKFEEDDQVEDFTNKYVISRIVERYSDFVTHPIRYKEKDGKAEDKPLNSMKPIWTRPRSEVTDEEYKEFYKHISHDWNEPMKSWSFRAEGRSEYQSLLFIPSQAPFDLFQQTGKFGLHLYVRRVLIMEHCEDLLPSYLRFVRGVVDSADLPLNVSRQRLQEDRHIAQIRKWLTRKVLDSFEDMLKNEFEKYMKFWKNFGRVMKEGAGFDFENKDKLLKLYLFESSNDPEKLTTLDRLREPDEAGAEGHLFHYRTVAAGGRKVAAPGSISGEGLRSVVSRRSRRRDPGAMGIRIRRKTSEVRRQRTRRYRRRSRPDGEGKGIVEPDG